MRTTQCAVYILTNRHHTVLYTGVTSDLRVRLAEHRGRSDPGSFAARYNAGILVYVETTPNIAAAITREKQIKGWTRRKKIELIDRANPTWADLAADWEP
jgi:putative endonuclease